jgi:uncharacterized protein
MDKNPQAETIDFLNRRAFGDLSVEVIRTHASMIFLAGDRALKLKRAIRYAFLDYSSPELRRHACEEEVLLNRRTAPDLYLGVRAVTRADNGALALDGAGKPVDWIVEMRRFPNENLFTRMVLSKRLTIPIAVELAGRIAEFHKSAAETPEYGGRAGLEEVLAINEKSFVATGLLANDVTAASRALLDRLSRILERRRTEGHVRQCHGDLHLGNIVLLDGKPTLFDGIEFSRSLACIDVLYDLAFVLMDLWYQGERLLCSTILNRYLDLTKESGGLAAMPLFLSLRAAVRAHVGAAAGNNEAQRYLDLARALTKPPSPRLIAIGGLSGTGKSVLAAALAPLVAGAPGARVLRSDVLRKRLLDRTPEERLPADAYTPAFNRTVYDALLAATEEALAAGCSVILDAVAARPSERDAFAAVASRHGTKFDGLWLEAPAAVLEARVERRQRDASDATADVVRQQLGYDLGELNWTKIDASGTPSETLTAATSVLGHG